MAIRSTLFAAFVVLLALVCGLSCGEDSDDENGDDDDDTPDPCATLPDLYVQYFSADVDDGNYHGTSFKFTEITICNGGGGMADAGFRFGFYLDAGAEPTSGAYVAYESDGLPGLSPGDCQTLTLNDVVGDLAEGLYYIYIALDIDGVVAECDEANNWARSDDAVHVNPDPSEPI